MLASFNGLYYIHYTFTCFSMVTSFIYEHTYNYYFLSKSFLDGVDNLIDLIQGSHVLAFFEPSYPFSRSVDSNLNASRVTWSFNPHTSYRASFSRLSPLIQVLDCERARSSMVVHRRAFLHVSISSSHASMVVHEKKRETRIRTADLRHRNLMLRPLDHDNPL